VPGDNGDWMVALSESAEAPADNGDEQVRRCSGSLALPPPYPLPHLKPSRSLTPFSTQSVGQEEGEAEDEDEAPLGDAVNRSCSTLTVEKVVAACDVLSLPLRRLLTNSACGSAAW
jgi:hypothetical protein